MRQRCVFGVMLVPSLFTFLWFSIFGDTALHLIMNEGYHRLIDHVQADQAMALFKLYEHLPLTSLISLVTVFLIITFFVTSSDSGSLVIDSLSAGGRDDSPVWHRAFWAITEGVVASTLLLAGGLKALQAMAITTALPFAVIMLLAALGMWRALVIEGHTEVSLQSHMRRTRHGVGGDKSSWKARLAGLVRFPDRAEVSTFITRQVMGSMKRAGGVGQARLAGRSDLR